MGTGESPNDSGQTSGETRKEPNQPSGLTPPRADVCSVCQETLEAQNDNPLVKLNPCNHKTHRSCIIPWFTNRDSCPICRVIVSSYTELDASGAETSVVTNVVRREANYPGPNSLVTLLLTDDCTITYIFLADAFVLRTGVSPVEFIRMDRLPARAQFTVAPHSLVPIYHLLIVQARYYVLGINGSYFSLESLVTSIARRMTVRRPAMVEANIDDVELN